QKPRTCPISALASYYVIDSETPDEPGETPDDADSTDRRRAARALAPARSPGPGLRRREAGEGRPHQPRRQHAGRPDAASGLAGDAASEPPPEPGALLPQSRVFG